jgi:5-formyltetrahydrofolate cyclo-ligase
LLKRQSLSAGEVAHRSARVFETFLLHREKLVPASARSIGLYYPVRGEVDTRSFFRAFLQAGVKCFFPRVEDRQRMEFLEVRDLAELRMGPFGIAEPHARPGAAVVPEAVLVPGVAFTPDCHRLGFGAGYFDRAIADWASASPPRLIGLAYDFQVLPTLPLAGHDRKLDFVVSEERVYS